MSAACRRRSAQLSRVAKLVYGSTQARVPAPRPPIPTVCDPAPYEGADLRSGPPVPLHGLSPVKGA